MCLTTRFQYISTYVLPIQGADADGPVPLPLCLVSTDQNSVAPIYILWLCEKRQIRNICCYRLAGRLMCTIAAIRMLIKIAFARPIFVNTEKMGAMALLVITRLCVREENIHIIEMEVKFISHLP